ncbi:DUF6518 family protein [Nonomuraea maritima]|uniref:DUF6518 family protein n=1 Tax=Nonomuraea maritima TaxID=683260 RepID=UPI003CCB935B
MSTTARPAQFSAARRVPASPWTLAALALGVGLVGGAATSFGQTVLSGGWHALVNSTAPWATVAFLVGLRGAPPATGAGRPWRECSHSSGCWPVTT